MSNNLWKRIYNYALANHHRKVWKRRLHALLYGASLSSLSRIKEKPSP